MDFNVIELCELFLSIVDSRTVVRHSTTQLSIIGSPSIIMKYAPHGSGCVRRTRHWGALFCKIPLYDRRSYQTTCIGRMVLPTSSQAHCVSLQTSSTHLYLAMSIQSQTLWVSFLNAKAHKLASTARQNFISCLPVITRNIGTLPS